MPTFRNELGEIIPVTDWGQPGVDFEDLQLIGCFKVGSLNLPHGTSEAYLKDCEVEETLDSVLVHHNVSYVKQVFEGLEAGDTLISVGTDSVRVPDLSQVYLLMQKPGGIVLDAVFDLYEVEATVYAEPVYYYFPDMEPDDTLWPDQWNLKKPNPQNEEFGIGCPTAWDSETGSTEVKVGVIDRRIYYDHYDLGGPGFPNDKVAGGYDYAEDDPDPIDPCGHGTKCAGIIGALTCNFFCVAGIAGGWDTWPVYNTGVRLYALKAWPDNCEGHGILPAILQAIYAGAHPDIFGCSILSNSWRSGGGAPNQSMRGAINTAYRLGVSFVASKGNDGNDNDIWPHYPSDYDAHWITAVGSYGQDGVRCTNDNCGYGSNFGGGIDIVAPGTAVPSTNTGGGCVTDFAGTSAACPHASGTIAL
jgi:subtilisin family serine protease